MTPTMVCAVPLMSTLRPMICGSDSIPRRPQHVADERRRLRRSAGRRSRENRVRESDAHPAAGTCPTRRARRCSAPARPHHRGRSAILRTTPAIVVNDVVEAFQSRRSAIETPASSPSCCFTVSRTTNPIRILVRIRLQEHAVDDAEDRRVDADPETEAEDADESRILGCATGCGRRIGFREGASREGSMPVADRSEHLA